MIVNVCLVRVGGNEKPQFHFNQNNHDIKFFSCQNHNSGYRKCSKTHYIRLDFLEQVVLYEVKRLACFASEYENDFIKAMIDARQKVAEKHRAPQAAGAGRFDCP